MKKFVAALFTVALSAASASAADMAARYTKAPLVAPIYNWTGFYVGLNAGGAWNESNVTSTVFSEGGYFADTSPAAIALAGNQNINKSGFTGGVTAGYNWQINNAMLGVETRNRPRRKRRWAGIWCWWYDGQESCQPACEYFWEQCLL